MKKLFLLLFTITLFAFSSGNVEPQPNNVTLSFTSTVKYFCYSNGDGVFVWSDINGDKHEVDISTCGTSFPALWDHMFVVIIQVEHPYTCHISGHIMSGEYTAGINVNGDCSNVVQIENEYPGFYASHLLNWGI